jgi:hypothetical protein
LKLGIVSIFDIQSMNFKFFESLTKAEAQEYLDEFLAFGHGRGIEILEKHVHFTVDIDFSLESISTIFKLLLPILRTIPREPDLSLPDFIRNTDSYKLKLFDFDEESKSIVLVGAYYLGESFVRSNKQLSWATGNTKFAEGNMPVVAKLKHKSEMAPILIAENMFGGIVAGTRKEDSIDIAIEAWKKEFS